MPCRVHREAFSRAAARAPTRFPLPRQRNGPRTTSRVPLEATLEPLATQLHIRAVEGEKEKEKTTSAVTGTTAAYGSQAREKTRNRRTVRVAGPARKNQKKVQVAGPARKNQKKVRVDGPARAGSSERERAEAEGENTARRGAPQSES